MKVLLVAYPFAPIADGTAGGAEQILRIVERGLCERGHETVVVAAEGSKVAGRLHPLPRAEPGDEAARDRTWTACKQAIKQIASEGKLDAIHYHGFDFPAYAADLDVPALATLHLPIDYHYENIFQLNRPNLWFNCVSQSQRRTCPDSPRLLSYVPNGIELDRWAFSADHDEYAMWLGRICPEKGVHHALAAARNSGVPLMLAGTLYPFPTHVEYFLREVAPRLDAERVYVGALDLADRARLLRRARCLIVPTEAQETSCLVAMEALASGTPVVALRRGAIPEVIEHGRTGFVVDTPEELASAIHRVAALDRRACRIAAEQHFDARDMVRRYEALYAQIKSRSARRITTDQGAQL